MTRLLIVDDDKELSDMLSEYLGSEGFEIDAVYNGLAAIERVKGHAYDALILDVMMPELDGFGVLRHIRSYSEIPVLMLTAKGDDIDRIVGLEMGADDYLPKPFNPRELLARIKAILRRQSPAETPDAEPVLFVSGLMMDSSTRVATANGQPVELTSTEFNILYLLLRQLGHVVTKETLSENVMGRALEKYDRSIDMHISNVRKKLSDYRLPLSIKTVRSQGYQLVAE